MNQANPNNTQNLIQIAEIRDGLVIMNDGSFRAVLLCRSINFDLMSHAEKESVELAYQGFLNSLYFPVQILIRSRQVNVSQYLYQISLGSQNQTNLLLDLLVDDHLKFIGRLVSEVELVDKSFFVVVPYFHNENIKENFAQNTQNFFKRLLTSFSNKQVPVTIDEKSIEIGRKELRYRIQLAAGGLDGCGVNSVQLSTKELIELYYESYNLNSTSRQHAGNLKDMEFDLITKSNYQDQMINNSQEANLPQQINNQIQQ